MADTDVEAIKQVVNLYGFAVDTQRWALLDRVFTEDVDADYSESAHWRDRATLKSDFAVYHDPFDGTQHAMMSHMVHVDGDKANALTYATWRLIRRGLDGGSHWEGAGWYDDALVRQADGWRIAKRQCRIIWWSGNPLVNETVPGVKFELHSTSLRVEANAGTVGFLAAIGG